MRIRELVEKKQENNIKVIAKYIAKNCKPFLVQINKHTLPLYRGQSDNLMIVCNQLFKSFTLEKRDPLDSSVQDHLDSNTWFKDKFGIGFRRDHIMFATSDKNNVFQYGTAYTAIPIGKFAFCWSPFVCDLAIEREKNRYDYMEEFLARSKYKTSNLDAAIKSGNEIMFHCKEYYLLKVTKNEYKQIIKMAKEMI